MRQLWHYRVSNPTVALDAARWLAEGDTVNPHRLPIGWSAQWKNARSENIKIPYLLPSQADITYPVSALDATWQRPQKALLFKGQRRPPIRKSGCNELCVPVKSAIYGSPGIKWDPNQSCQQVDCNKNTFQNKQTLVYSLTSHHVTEY